MCLSRVGVGSVLVGAWAAAAFGRAVGGEFPLSLQFMLYITIIQTASSQDSGYDLK